MEKYSGYFYYGIPQSLYGRWRAKDSDRGRFIKVSGGRCEYRDTMIGMAGGLMGRDINRTRRVLRWMIREAGYGERGEPGDWVRRLISWGRM